MSTKVSQGGLLIFLMLVMQFLHAQNEHWFFGLGGPGIDFTSGSPIQNNGLSPISFNESVTVVSDGSGNLLFYSNGEEVYDKNHLLMPSGTFLGTGGSSAAQGVVSISHPSNPNKYYLFTADDTDNPLEYGIRWHEVDISVPGNGTIANPSGDVVSSDNVVVPAAAEMLTAYGCGDTIWVVGHGKGNNNFYAIPVTSAGPQAPVISSVGIALSGPQVRGSLAFNSAGTQLVSANPGEGRILNFDSNTGVISNERLISGAYYGSEWSSTNNVIYLTAASGSKALYHYDVALGVRTLIDNSHFYGEIVHGRDGNLYIGKWVGESNTHLGLISSPNSLIPTAAGIGFDKDGWDAGGIVAYGLPQIMACPIIICPDTTTIQPDPICVGDSVDLTRYIVGDPGYWTIIHSPSGTHPATLSGNIFNASNLLTDPGVYSLEFKSASFHSSCDSVSQREIVVNPLPVVDIGMDTSICAGENIVFDAVIGSSWLWNNGMNTQTITVDSAFLYSVAVTDINGCLGHDSVYLNVNPLPLVELGSDTAICFPNTLSVDAKLGVSWNWSVGLSSQTILVDSTGDFSVVVTDSNGCVGHDTINVIVNDFPRVKLGGDTAICMDSAITFDAKVGVDWLWSNGGGTQTITVSKEGVYDVVVTDSNGCKGYDTVLLVTNALPVVDLGRDTSICSDRTITFFTSVGDSWLWNTGATNDSIIVDLSGEYSVMVSDGNGCVGFDTVQLTVNDLPEVQLSNDTAVCSDSIVVLDAIVGKSWIWNTGETTKTIMVGSEMEYSVIITDSNGCVGYDTIFVSKNPLPIVDLGGDTAICDGGSVFLDVGVWESVFWSSGQTSWSISVAQSGDYSVIVTDSNNCVGYDTVAIFVNQLPVVDIGNDTAICSNETIILEALTGTDWTWSTGEKTQTILVSSKGEYDVVVVDSNGCAGYDTMSLAINELPLVDIGRDTAICADSTVSFGTNVGDKWQWSNGENTSDITVKIAGEVSVIVTDSNGCVGYDTAVVSINPLPFIEMGNDTAICEDNTLTISVNQGEEWYWSTGDTTQSIVVNMERDYGVVVIDSNGCVGYDTLSLKLNPLPVVDLGPDSSICLGDSIVIYGPSGAGDYVWSIGQVGRDSISINYAGQYSLIFTDSNNCVGYDTMWVTVDALPSLSLGADSSLCMGDSMIALSSKDAVNYNWNTGDTTQTIIIDSAGEYFVEVINVAGCFNYDTLVVSIDTIPKVVLGSDTAICFGDTLALKAGKGDHYLWNNGQNSSSINVWTDGDFSVQVINSFNCIAHDSIRVKIMDLPLLNISEDQFICEFKPLTIGVESGFEYYEWNTGENSDSITISVPGSYFVVVEDVNGCTKSDTVEISYGGILNVEIEADSVVCEGEATQADLKINNESGFTQIVWSTGDSSEREVFDSTGIYSVLVIDSMGCWGVDTFGLFVKDLPVISLISDSNWICSLIEAQEAITINAKHNGEYVQWHTGEVGDELVLMQSGVVIASVFDSVGCFSHDTMMIKEYCPPVTITMPNIFTPNNDGMNDKFIPLELAWENYEYIMYHVEKISFKVLNRWGERILVSKEVLPLWDGLNNKGAEAPSGTYFWILEYTDINGSHFKNNGFVELTR